MDRWNSVPEMMQSIRSAVLKIALGLAGLAALFGDWPSVFGLSIGTLVALWHFGSLATSMQKAINMRKEQAEVYALQRYLGRYGVVAVVVAAIYLTPQINLLAAVFGLFLVRIVIVGYAVQAALASGGAAYLRQLTLRRVRKEG
ncbi:MAG: ATP synthase subunit I [Bacillota bacterium]|jgi:hypothetical protein